MTDVREARAAHLRDDPHAVPCGAGRSQPFSAELRAKKVEVDGQSFYRLTGVASTVEEPYEMYDMFGPYMEIMDREAFDNTLERNPDVAFLLNHRGVTMARTTQPGRLTLSADEQGLNVVALVNPKRQDVQDMVTAIEDGDITEMSFAFRIVRGQWSPDYEEFRIKEVDLDRGDVSAVNYGANPYTNIAARSAEILRQLDELPAGAARAAVARLAAREDVEKVDGVDVREADEAEESAELVEELSEEPEAPKERSAAEVESARLAEVVHMKSMYDWLDS